MRRLRESWLALGGSALIIALSVSSALGADPAFDPDNVGQQVSEFARSLAPGQNQDGDEPDAEEQPDLEEDEQLDEADEADDEADGDAVDVDAQLEPGDEGFDWSTVGHGFCVSWHARADETAEENLPEEGGEWENHGEFVSDWARVGCNESSDDTEDADEAAAADEDGERSEKAKKEKKNNGRNGNGRGRGGRR